MLKQKKQKGSSLLLSLIALGIVTAMIGETHLFVSHGQRVVSSQASKAEIINFLLAGEAWIEQQLIEDTWPNRDGQILGEEEFEFEGGKLNIKVVDFDSCINVNRLHGGDHQVKTHNALIRLADSKDGSTAWVGVVKDWIDSDEETSAQGAEDWLYMAKTSPYRSANTTITGDYEWTLLDADIVDLKEVVKFVCATPNIASTININTAPVEVLTAMLPSLSTSQAESIVERQKSAPFKSIEELSEDGQFQNIKLDKKTWSTTTKNVSGIVVYTNQDQTYWLQTIVSIDHNGIVKSSNRAFIEPNELVRERFNLEESNL